MERIIYMNSTDSLTTVMKNWKPFKCSIITLLLLFVFLFKDPILFSLFWPCHMACGILVPLCVLVTQVYLTLCDPVGCSPPGSSVHGISQARILEWVSISFSRGSSRPRDQTQVSCTAGRFLPSEPSVKPKRYQCSFLLLLWVEKI